MSKPVSSEGNTTRKLSDIVVIIAFTALAAAMLVTLTDILLRLAATLWQSVHGTRPLWRIFGVIDLMQLFVMIGVPLAVAVNFLSNRHISIDLLQKLWGAGFLRLAQCLTGLAGLAVMGTCVWTAWGQWRGQSEFASSTATLGLPMSWYWAALLVGLILSLIGCVPTLLAALRR